MRANELVLARLPSLSPKLQAAARFIVDHPNEVVIASMRQVAERAGAQPATLVRLAQQLGFPGWPELKSAFAKDMGLHAEGYAERTRSLLDASTDGERLSALFDVHRRNLELTEVQCAGTLREAVELLQQARAVHVAGFRVSYPVAYAFVYGYRLFRNPVHLIDGQGGGLGMQLRPIGREDVVMAISVAPYSRETLTVVEAAREVGAYIISMTDSATSPLAMTSDVSMLLTARAPAFLPTAASAMTLVETLLELLVVEAGPTAAKQIDRAEQRLFESGADLQPPARRLMPVKA